MNKSEFEALCDIWRIEHQKFQDISGIIDRAIARGALK